MATLADQHRRQQDTLANLLARFMLARWRQKMTTVPSDQMTAEWLAVVTPAVMAYRERSVGTARLFYDRGRRAAMPGAPRLTDVPREIVPREALETALRVTGPIAVYEALGRGQSPAEALARAGTKTAGAASRIALDGGRRWTLNAVRSDVVALGYYRNTKDGCCYFCAMLASRGRVYKENSFEASDLQFLDDPDMPSTAKVHDHCHCTLEPIYTREQAIPDRNDAFADLWMSVTTPGVDGPAPSGKDAMRAFRNAYEAKYGRWDG